MAVFTETIVLDDKVSATARSASKVVGDLAGGLEAANKTLVKTEGLAEKALGGPIREAGGKFAKKGAPIAEPPSPTPEAPALRTLPSTPAVAPPAPSGPAPSKTPAPGPASAPSSTAFDKVALSAETAKKLTDQFTAQLKAAEVELAKSAALGDQVGYDKALAKMGQYSAALAKLPPQQAEIKQSAEQSAKPIEQMATTSAKAGRSLSEMWADAAHAAMAGKEIIGGAAEGIKNAFASLAAGDAKGVIEGITDTVAGLAKALDLVVPGLGEVVSAVIKIAGGLAGITVGLIQSGAEFAIEANQGKAAMISMFTAMGQGVTTGAEVDDMLSGLADRIGISKDKLAGLTKEFMKLGITGVGELEKLTLAAQSASAIVGSDMGAKAFQDLTQKIQLAAQTTGTLKLDNRILRGLSEAGLTVDDLAKGLGTTADKLKDATVDATKLGDAMTTALIEKGKGPLDKLASSLGAIKERFSQMMGDIFEDIDVGPFLKEVKSLFETIFSQATPAGESLKSGIGGFFQKVFDLGAKVVPMVKHFLLYIILYGLKAYNALFPIIRAFVLVGRAISTALSGVFDKASAGTSGFLDTLTNAAAKVAPYIAKLVDKFGELVTWVLSNKTIMDALGVAFKAIGAVLVVIGVAIGVVVAAFILLAGVIVAINAGMMVLAGTIISAVGSAMETLNGWATSAYEAASNFITGLIEGITAGAGKVVDAVKNVASGAVDAFTDFLGIKSPSTLMMKMGGHMTEGAAMGIEAGAPDVHGAASEMANLATQGVANAPPPPSPAVAATAQALGAGAAPGAGGGGTQIVFEAGSIQISGQGKDWSEVTEEMFQAVAERLAMQAGVA